MRKKNQIPKKRPCPTYWITAVALREITLPFITHHLLIWHCPICRCWHHRWRHLGRPAFIPLARKRMRNHETTSNTLTNP